MEQTGNVYGMLTVVGVAGADPHGRKFVAVRCSCGGELVARLDNVRRGMTKSCGCVRVTNNRARFLKHGETTLRRQTPEYKAWVGMKERCHNPRNKAFPGYGGRGIEVCAEWRESFPAFLAHVGRRPNAEMSLDRIDNDRGYEPGNVRWADAKTQANNRRPRRCAS